MKTKHVTHKPLLPSMAMMAEAFKKVTSLPARRHFLARAVALAAALPACALAPPENPNGYPEPGMFGKAPAYAFYLRHVKAIEVHHVKVGYVQPEGRTAVVLDDP